MAKVKHQKEKRETEDLKEEGIEVGGTVIEKFPGGMLDRKSTRLNSSH